MIRGIRKSRMALRIAVVAAIAIVLIGSMGAYLQMTSQKQIGPTSLPLGEAFVTGLPDSVNLTAARDWVFPIQLTVTESYVSGVTFNITGNSTFSGASAYFASKNTEWKQHGGNLSMQSTRPYFEAGSRDGNLTLVIHGGINATGWVGISASSAVGTVLPSFHRVYLFIYREGQHQNQQYIRFANLPGTVVAASGSTGTYGIIYSTAGISAPVTWLASVPWVNVSEVNSTAATAYYRAPQVSSNTSFVVAITATSADGITNTSTLTFNVLISKPVPQPAGSIEFVNLPAALTVASGSSGQYTISYYTLNVTGTVQWTANESWLTVTTLNGTTAEARYTVPSVASNATFTVAVTASADGITNTSTITFMVIAQEPTQKFEIMLLNLPAVISVLPGSTGTFDIRYDASGAQLPVTWKSALPWISIRTVNSTTAAATYTAPEFSSTYNYSTASGQPSRIYADNISVYSSGALANSSTLILNVAPAGSPVITSAVTTIVHLNESQYTLSVTGGIQANIVIPKGQTYPVLLVYTEVVMNRSTLESQIGGGVNLNIYANSPAVLTVYMYRVMLLDNSSFSQEITGGFNVHIISKSAVSARFIMYNETVTRNSTLTDTVTYQGVSLLHTVIPAGTPGQTAAYQPFFTMFSLTRSSISMDIDKGVKLSFNMLNATGTAVTTVLSLIRLSDAHLEIAIPGGVVIDLRTVNQSTQILFTSIILTSEEMKIRIDRLTVQ